MNKVCGILCAMVLVSTASFGQETQKASPPAAQTEQGDGRHYQVVFVAREVEGGKVINTRRYETNSALQGANDSGAIRAGAKVPVITSGNPTSSTSQYRYEFFDVGVNFDFKNARVEADRAFLVLTAEISSFEPVAPDSILRRPIVRQNKWNGGVTVLLGKPTVVFSSDDVSSKRTMQVELTVTPVR